MSTPKNVQKILFAIPNLKYGGAEIFLLRLTSALDQGFQVKVVVIGDREGLAIDFEERGICVEYLELANRAKFMTAIRGVRKIIHDFHPDVIQSFLYYADFVTTLSSFPFNTRKLFWSFRGSSLPDGNSALKKFALSFNIVASWLLPIQIIACSEQAMSFHKRIGFRRKKIIVIPNFLSDWVFKESFSTSNLFKYENPKTLKIGLAARFDPGKGHLELIKACAELLKEESQLQLISLSFAGKGCEVDGRLHSEILLQSLSLDKIEIMFNGILQHDEMVHWYQAIDLYVMPSDGIEGFPNSLSEAVALGVPAIATNYGCAIAFVGESRIIDTPDANSICSGLKNLLREPISLRVAHSTIRAELMRKSYSQNAVLPLFLKTWSRE
jgi:glycosyltransferase involved in cell wall biosynthesis